MIVVVIQVDLFIGFWSLVHDSIEGIFGKNVDLVSR
jgi:hypothetical protein